MSNKKFNELLLEAVDDGLSSLGESVRLMIYFHLEKSFNVKKQEIAYKPSHFSSAIEMIFGFGANFLKILILERLYEKVGRRFERQGSGDIVFTEYVASAKQSFLEKRRTTRKKMPEELVQCVETVVEGENI